MEYPQYHSGMSGSASPWGVQEYGAGSPVYHTQPMQPQEMTFNININIAPKKGRGSRRGTASASGSVAGSPGVAAGPGREGREGGKRERVSVSAASAAAPPPPIPVSVVAPAASSSHTTTTSPPPRAVPFGTTPTPTPQSHAAPTPQLAPSFTRAPSSQPGGTPFMERGFHHPEGLVDTPAGAMRVGSASASPQRPVIFPPPNAVTTVYIQECGELDTTDANRWTRGPAVQADTGEMVAGVGNIGVSVDDAIRCDACGTHPPPNSNFCCNCGWRLTPLPQPVEVEKRHLGE